MADDAVNLEWVKNAPDGELKMVATAISKELYSRYDERKKTCQHPVEHRGQMVSERPGNFYTGCVYCWTFMEPYRFSI